MLLLSSSRDDWERLVAAVLKREQYLQLCHMPYSRSSSISTTASDLTSNFNQEFLNYKLGSISVPQLRPPELAVSQVGNTSTPIKRKLFFAWYRRRKTKDDYFFNTRTVEGRKFSLQELQIATNNFGNKIKYGCSTVYKGSLPDGSLVAIKRYRNISNKKTNPQFEKEIEVNGIAAHPNVLHMLGVCVTLQECFVVYPLLENGSAASCLRGRRKSEHPLNWAQRKRIAMGVAWGLSYLHHGCSKKIIHRDLKAANILLNDEFEAVVADFRLAVTMDYKATHINTSIAGTLGHMAPEYLSFGTCSEKSDVFSYGIFLLELVTGERAFDLIRVTNDEDMLLDWIKRNFMERKWERIVDPDCEGDHEEIVEQLMQVAMCCTHNNPSVRPKMYKVVGMLEEGTASSLSSERWTLDESTN